MLSENDVFNLTVMLPPEKRSAVLEILGCGEGGLFPSQGRQYNSECSEFFCYVVEGIKYPCIYGTSLDWYLEHLDANIEDWEINDGYVPKPVLEKEKLIADFHAVQQDMLSIGWDGDYSQQPSILFLPCPESEPFEVGFVWKQHRNDLMFIASPVPLSWLGEAKIKKGDVR